MFRSFLPKANSQSPKKSKSIQANLFARLCIIYWYYFITFSQLFLVDGLFWTYWRLMYHVNGLALSFFFESGLNVHKLMNSLINNQLKRYWSKILIGITKDWTGNSQWYSVVLFHGTILSGSKGDDYFEIKTIVTSHALNYILWKTVPDVQPTRFSLFYFVLFYLFFSLLTFLCTVSWLSERLDRAIRVW